MCNGAEAKALDTPTLDGVKSDMGNTIESPVKDNAASALDLAHFAHADINITDGKNTTHTNGIKENDPSLTLDENAKVDTTHSRLLNNLIGVRHNKE